MREAKASLRHLVLTASAVLLAASAHAADAPGAMTEQQLEQQLTQMQQQMDAMKAQLQQLKQQNDALATQQQQQAAQSQVAASAPPSGGISPNLNLWGYGEIYYTDPVHDQRLAEFDLARAVFGIGYRLDDRTNFNSEFEVEHAVASAVDKGEFEVEQFYIDHQWNDWASVKAGLFLMPFGLLNEHHEPTAFYGVQRNFVETLIIPSTWREGGLGFHGSSPIGLNWDVGLTTGLSLTGWNNSPEDPTYRTALDLEDNDVAPMQAMHQELALADAQHLSQYLSLNYTGQPGLLVGAAVFTGKLALPVVPPDLPDERLTLWETHARWTPGQFDLSALYARGSISGTATYNLENEGVANPVPSQFIGYYAQAAYNLWQHGDAHLAPFVRWEHYDMGAQYAGILPGFTTTPSGLAADGKPWPQPRDRVWTFGANYWYNPHLVFKADYQDFAVNGDFSRFDLGLGLAF